MANKYKHPYFPKLDPERQWLFRLELTVGPIGLDSEILSVNAHQVTLPGVTITPIVVPHMNLDVKFAGRPAQGDMSVTFLTAYNKDAVDQLEQWMTKIYDEDTENIGLVEEYKVDGVLVVLKPGLVTWKEYKINGVFPTSVGDRSYDWAASAHVVRTATFSVDKVLPPTIRGTK